MLQRYTLDTSRRLISQALESIISRGSNMYMVLKVLA